MNNIVLGLKMKVCITEHRTIQILSYVTFFKKRVKFTLAFNNNI